MGNKNPWFFGVCIADRIKPNNKDNTVDYYVFTGLFCLLCRILNFP